MKRFMVLLFIAFVCVLPCNAQFVDDFDYPAGDTLANYWHSMAPLGNLYYMRITDTGLMFPYYAGSGIGRAVKLDTLGPDGAYAFFSYGGVTTGGLYISFMLKVSGAGPAGSYFTGILPFSSISAYGRVYVKDSSGHLAFGVSKSSELPHYTRAKYQKDVTYLILLKYEFQAGTNDDLVSLFVFRSAVPYIEPDPDVGPEGAGSEDIDGAFRFALFQCYEGNHPGAIFDGVYIDDHWNNYVLPAELAAFNAEVIGDRVKLRWITSAEMTNAAFDIERKSVSSVIWQKAGSVKGNGTTNEQSCYSYTDRPGSSGVFNYRLKQIDFNGNFEYFELPEAVTIGVPYKYFVDQNYPNPFNPLTTIAYGIPQSGNVVLKIFDMAGREIRTLVNEYKDAGYYAAKFDGSSLASGTYIYRIESGSFVSAKKMVLLK